MLAFPADECFAGDGTNVERDPHGEVELDASLVAFLASCGNPIGTSDSEATDKGNKMQKARNQELQDAEDQKG